MSAFAERHSPQPDEVLRFIADQALAGRAIEAIARDLNEQQVPVSRGGARWYHSSVRAVLDSRRGQAMLEQARGDRERVPA
jgi:hypothetical protein